jgi:hypothetical protein
MLSPAMETSNITPSVYSVHALTLLSEVNIIKCFHMYAQTNKQIVPINENSHTSVFNFKNHFSRNHWYIKLQRIGQCGGTVAICLCMCTYRETSMYTCACESHRVASGVLFFFFFNI